VELRIGDRSVDLRWSTVVVAPAPGPRPTPGSSAALIERGADAVLITVAEAECDPAWSSGGVPFCCAAGDVPAAIRAIDVGASFVVLPDSAIAGAASSAGIPRSAIVVAGPTAGEPIGAGGAPELPLLRDLRDTDHSAGDNNDTGNSTDDTAGIGLADVAAAALLDAESTCRVVLIDDPRPARRCADLVETLRREQAGVPS